MRRRAWLLSAGGACAGLVVGWALLPPGRRIGLRAAWPRDAEAAVALNGWLKLTRDGEVLLAMPRCELGQGVHTALAMLVADELDMAPARVRPVAAGADAVYGNIAAFVAALPGPGAAGESAVPALDAARRWTSARTGQALSLDLTAGSASLADAWEPLRLAAATARAQLIGAASLWWRLPRAELSVADGVVVHPSGASAGYGELARRAAGQPVSGIRPKPREAWHLIGTPVPRLDLPAKCDGRAVLGMDVRPPGLLHAALRHAPQQGGSPGRCDADDVLRRPGVERVVRLPPYAGGAAAIAVVARSTWHAQQAVDALDIEWRAPPAGALDPAALRGALDAAARAGRGETLLLRGEPDTAAVAGGATVIEALYRLPWQAHVTPEPPNCTARVDPGVGVELWVATQAPELARRLAAEVAGVAPDAVTLHLPYAGGGFGRGLELDVVGQAVRIALETGGRPVQLVWSRAEDLAHDRYRPAASVWLRGGVGADGLPAWIDACIASDSPAAGWAARHGLTNAAAQALIEGGPADGLGDLPYAVPHLRLARTRVTGGLPVGPMRGGPQLTQVHGLECFLDELAAAGGRDPLDVRLALLRDEPRLAAVLRLAAQQAGWAGPAAPGRARGLALHRRHGTAVALVAEVSLAAAADRLRPRVHRIVCAVDAGTIVHPGLAAQQVESGVVFGLAAALGRAIELDASGAVRPRRLTDHPLPRLADMPVIETHFVASSAPPGGLGEAGAPAVPAALANALARLTGRRWRELPLQGTAV